MSDERGGERTARAEIDVLLKTEQTFEPPAEFAAQANASDPGIYERADADPEAWWGSWAEKLDWIEPWDEVLDWSDPPFAKWFTGGKLNVSANCLDRHVDAGNGDRVAFYWEGEDATRKEITYAWLLERDAAVRQRAQVARRRQGRRRRDLHADGPRGGRRDARLHPDRRDPQRRLRRLLRRTRSSSAWRSRTRRRSITADATMRRGKPTPMKEALDEVLVDLDVARARDRRQPRRHRPADDRRPRPLLARPRRRRRRRVRARADGRRGPALHPLHVGLDRRSRRGSCTPPAAT